MHVFLVINNLTPGTGPFQRIIKLDKTITVSVISLFDSQPNLIKISTQFGMDTSHIHLYGLCAKNRLIALLKLYNLVRKTKPDIIQSVHTFSDIICVFMKYFTKTPVISFEGTLINRWSFLKKYIVLFNHSLVDTVVCVSNNTYKVNNGISNTLSKFTNRCIIYNGVDLKLIDKLAKNKITENNLKTIGYTGDLKSVKNLTILFQAFKKCSMTNKNIRLVIVGSGPEEYFLKNLACELGISVNFTGQISRLEVLKLLNSLDIFVMPSLVEGLSESIVQAMASRVPVIASDIDANRELIDHNETGLLFKSGNSDDLKHQMLKLINEEVDVDYLVNNARKYIELNLNINDITDKYTKLYLEHLK
mgnify:CR=1 FL=1